MRRTAQFARRVCVSVLLIFLVGMSAPASTPYETYTYDWRGYPTSSPHAFAPSQIIRGGDLGIGALRFPADVFVGRNGSVFLADSGNNRVVVMNPEFEIDRVIEGFEASAGWSRFSNPQGLFVDERNHLYVADTGNERVVELGPDDRLVNEFGRPDTDLIDPNAPYEPLKIVLDSARRMYLVVRGVNQGLMELDSSGRFRGFMGANRVTPNALDYLWRLIATDEQRARLQRFVPTEYSNATIDGEGYIYVTTASVGNEQVLESLNPADLMAVRKLNLTGTDVLRVQDDQLPPVGDVSIGVGFGATPSQFVDVAIGPAETYATLDRVRGRIFLYNSDGILLAAFGRVGERFGNVRGPASLAFHGTSLLVLDGILNQILVFRPTEYGQLLMDANVHYHERRYAESADAWRQVSAMNTNLEVAYAGIGKAQLRAGQYRDAMTSFKLAHVTSYYTKAFELYRREVVERNFGLIMSSVAGIIVALVVIRVVRRRRGSSEQTA